MSTTTTTLRHEPNILVRFLWFILIGWWLSGVVIVLAWLASVTVIGLPIGLLLLNRLPALATLKATPGDLRITYDEQRGRTTSMVQSGRQRPFALRALWFVFVGWWLTGLWLAAAWFLSWTVIGLPIAFWMYAMVGTVVTLRR